MTQYFDRIEFQQRGFPHPYAILWVQDSPQPTTSDMNMCSFVDKYVRTYLPTDTHLNELVTSRQTHLRHLSREQKTIF